jgi:hypothetical protein
MFLSLQRTLQLHGITGTAHKLIRSYLEGRYQRTKITDKYLNTSFSPWDLIKHGVPQGCVGSIDVSYLH